MQNASQTPRESDVDISDLSELATIDELVASYPKKFTKAQLQWQLRFREENGLDAAVIKFGRRIYFHVPTLLRVMASRRSVA